MRKTIIIMTICGWLLAGGAVAVPGAGEVHVFNVLNYGAVGDDQTDNIEAFTACLKAVVAAGGGRMYLPAGVYRGGIVIPAVSKPIPSWITVEIVGESQPTPVFGTIGSFPLLKNGTIVKSLSKSGPAVISASSSPDSLYGGFSGVNVVIKNLDVRTYDDPGIGGIDLHYALQCHLENVFINTGVYNVQASKPTHGTRGLTTPACNNAALTILRNVVVTGYHTGILVNEHTDGDNIVVASNINGLEFVFAHHASRFGRVGTYRNTHHITVSGRHGFSIEQMNTEQPGPGQTDAQNVWQVLVSNINDPKNLGIADINYWVVEGNVGAVEKFTRNGGASIRARRIGSAPGHANAALIPDAGAANASSQYDAAHGADKARDGILASDDVQNFWASANGQDVGAWWQTDLGQIINIAEIQVHFRAFDGRYHFVPKTITFKLSDDGKDWRTAISKSADVPANNSVFSDKFYRYLINAKGRYVRLLFEDGTDDRVIDDKAVELVEVNVIKADAANEKAVGVRLPLDVPPVIGCWFWNTADREPENFKSFIDNIAKHTAFNILTESIRIGTRYMTDQDVIDATRKAADYARTKGIGIAPELGFWSSFPNAYPKEPLQMIRLVTANLADKGEVRVETSYETKWNHLQGWPFEVGPARVARVCSYVRGAQGIDPKTVEDITWACHVVLQDCEGEVPASLAALCKNWIRLDVPTPLK